jgi:hypothetical protein
MNGPNDPHVAAATKAIHQGDFEVAASEFRASIESGNQWGKIGLALMHIRGSGLAAPDGRTAETLLWDVASDLSAPRSAAALAFNNLSILYIIGAVGVEPDAERAAECALKARELGFEVDLTFDDRDNAAAKKFVSDIRSGKESVHIIGHKATENE